MKTTRLYAFAAIAALSTLPAIGSAQRNTTKAMGRSSMKNIVQVAAEAGNFTTLGKALHAAGLVATLEGAGPFTVFAPTDAAFAKLPAGTLESLLDNKERLTSILAYHVVPGKVMAADILAAKGARPATVNGQPLDVIVRDRKVFVNGAQVIVADIAASNGVIHVIDAVLLPKAAAVPAGH